MQRRVHLPGLGLGAQRADRAVLATEDLERVDAEQLERVQMGDLVDLFVGEYSGCMGQTESECG